MTSGLTPVFVESLINTGMRQSEIAREYGVSRQYVNKLAKEAGYISSTKILSNNSPWQVPTEYQGNTLYQSFRAVGHYNLNGEKGFTETDSQLRKARVLVKKLTVFHQVVDFDPSYPAIPGVVNLPGFAFLPRTEADGGFMMKIRPSIQLTELGKSLWKLPPMF